VPRTEIGKAGLYPLRGIRKFFGVRFLDWHAGQDISAVVPRVNWDPCQRVNPARGNPFTHNSVRQYPTFSPRRIIPVSNSSSSTRGDRPLPLRVRRVSALSTTAGGSKPSTPLGTL
jgi:hypothetical protein